jgi:hypothetical protein
MTRPLNETYLNRLRLLGERERFYKPGDWMLTSLARNGLVVRTGSQDRFGREEWSITDDGRKAIVSNAGRRTGITPHEAAPHRARSQGS